MRNLHRKIEPFWRKKNFIVSNLTAPCFNLLEIIYEILQIAPGLEKFTK